MSPTGRAWGASYLPHIPRCRTCVMASRTASPDGPVPGLPAADVDIRAAHDSDTEIAGIKALRDILAEHDLRRWMFTDLVMVNETIRGGFSHPLTIGPGLLLRRPASALTTFLHEQLHWISGPGLDDATAEAASRWPHPPGLPAGGRDAQSTWLHMTVCALEHQSLREILGATAAATELSQHEGYSWIYAQILADPGWFASFLKRHSLQVPTEPPIPRRYCGEEWWTRIT